MKLWIQLVLTGVAAAGGFALGYFVRKKTAEVVIEEISMEELNKLAEDKSDEKDEKEPEAVEELPKQEKGNEGQALNTQKEAYFRKWKAEDAMDQYDTRTQDDPEDPMIFAEEDFRIDDLDDEEHAKEEPKEPEKDIPDRLVPQTMEEWNHQLGAPDGEYDTVELRWYSQDDIVTDDNDQPMENQKEFVTMNLEELFDEVSPDTTGDPDIRILLNRKHHTMYHITRVDSSYRWKKIREEYGTDGYDTDEDLYDRFHR